ncbi:unnamed protein product [Bursaphelenchus xylophilus]|uniref:(pine wood nematode) hypothetical protein n=1 Tax=Bursaphelenchus xylophilus TaxID=6326 RepID=A0A1I7RV64_BURXY|nr:unnamed protein product [Bursaphelenchus xylophilus]CAG9124653.1 unnamed protein product [Bursaphelenchus xylophilus]
MLLTSTICQLIYIWLYNIGQSKVEINNGHVFVVLTGPLRLLPLKAHYFMYSIFIITTFAASNVLLFEVYYTRQIVFENYHMTIEDIQKFALCSILFGILLGLWGIYCAMEAGDPSGYVDFFAIYQRYYVNKRPMDYLVLNKDQLGFKVFFCLIATSEGVSVSMAFYWGRYIYMDVYNKDTKVICVVSKEQHKLLKIIVIHAAIIIFQAILPMAVTGIAVLLEWQCYYIGTIGLILRTTIPISHPLTILLIINPYRLVFRKRVNNETETGTFTENITYMS